MRLILWGIIIAVVAYLIMRGIFYLGALHTKHKLDKERSRVIDTPGWKPPEDPHGRT